MLTADHVEVRRRGEQLFLKSLDEEDRLRGLSLAESYLGLARAHLGRERGQLLEAAKQIPVAARDRKLAAGLLKLVLDRCHFEEETGLSPAAVRAELFARAATSRQALEGRATFDRQAVLEASAAVLGQPAARLEEALYADLPDAHRLQRLDLPGRPEQLLAAYQAGGVQAVLLRAVSVRAQVTGAGPADFRYLFRKLKFLRLLHQIEPLPARGDDGGGYQITIDGPYSLFESVTRYGLQLALAYPALAACGRYQIEADVRWGKERRPLRFLVRGQADPRPSAPARPPALPPEVEALRAAIAERGGPWKARQSTRLLALPGAGVLVPDLELVHDDGTRVGLEVLGFWSREAVWRRIELAPHLPFPMIFAVSKNLRVSEAALPENLPAALHVYTGTLSPRALLTRADTLRPPR